MSSKIRRAFLKQLKCWPLDFEILLSERSEKHVDYTVMSKALYIIIRLSTLAHVSQYYI